MNERRLCHWINLITFNTCQTNLGRGQSKQQSDNLKSNRNEIAYYVMGFIAYIKDKKETKKNIHFLYVLASWSPRSPSTQMEILFSYSQLNLAKRNNMAFYHRQSRCSH